MPGRKAKGWYISYVKSPVASLCFVCSSVKNRVNVTIFVFTLVDSEGGISWAFPLAAMLASELGVRFLEVAIGRVYSTSIKSSGTL